VSRAIRIGLTMGDPAGIGPEILLKACRQMAQRVQAGEIELLAIGTRSVFQAAADELSLGARLVDNGSRTAWPDVAVIEATRARGDIPVGKVSAEAGRMAYAAVEVAARMALAHEIDAMVTAPFSKDALNLAGYHYAGHTELLAHLTSQSGTVMMLAHGDLRVSHVSTHVALSKVPSLVTPERVRRVIDLTCDALRAFGIERPRIAVAALNPHAGESGLFGTEDDDVLVPVVESYRKAGVDVSGPHPGDTIFVKGAAGQFDAIIAMYHDQGHIPIKLLGFRIDRSSGMWTELGGINVTLGLPIIRTSVDHGTAFDIARKGVANPQSMVEAIEYAVRLAAGRQSQTKKSAGGK
jgi:4-hydroxythreonine-4-phosphate dehydrogenase